MLKDSEAKLLAEYNAFHGEMAASWEVMGEGGPTLAALAAVCAWMAYHIWNQ